jgi:hypothetical protein
MSTENFRQVIMAWLKRRADDHKGNLLLLISGAGLFFLGTGLIVWVEQYMESSVGQELIALSGMLLCAIGGSIALFGYLGLSLLRLIKFFTDKP